MCILPVAPLGRSIGETEVRGIPAEVWEALGNKQDDIAEVVRLYFSKADVGVSINGIGENRILLRVEAKDKNKNEVLAISLYDYYTTDDQNEFLKNFNIEDCQGTYQYVEIIFARTYLLCCRDFLFVLIILRIKKSILVICACYLAASHLAQPFRFM